MLVAPLNWGLGHASRCVPIINALQKANFQPVIASDGNALKFLQKEFPALQFFTLPSYNLKYSKNGKYLVLKLLMQLPYIHSAIKKEKKQIEELIANEDIAGIISDNRFGVYSAKIPSVYITHQTQVLSGILTYFTTKIHHKIIEKYHECWIPDTENRELSGVLSNCKGIKTKVSYIGTLSRLKCVKSEKKNQLLVLLSGLEPQRTLLENTLLNELKNFNGNVLFVRGVLHEERLVAPPNLTMVNYLKSEDLEKAMNESEMVIARSGYSTIMDLAALGKKAYFIPTPGQYEQLYLAKYLANKKIAPYCKQNDFKVENLNEVNFYSGFLSGKNEFDLKLFSLFNSK